MELEQSSPEFVCLFVCLFVDLVNTVYRDNVRSRSNQIKILFRTDTTCFTLMMLTMRVFCRGTIVTQLLSVPCCFFVSQYIQIAW